MSCFILDKPQCGRDRVSCAAEKLTAICDCDLKRVQKVLEDWTEDKSAKEFKFIGSTHVNAIPILLERRPKLLNFIYDRMYRIDNRAVNRAANRIASTNASARTGAGTGAATGAENADAFTDSSNLDEQLREINDLVAQITA
tara:strand:+ start:18943 stop:19368 length:426 start_codon:yes stop_codon:yes gene_type:complete